MCGDGFSIQTLQTQKGIFMMTQPHSFLGSDTLFIPQSVLVNFVNNF